MRFLPLAILLGCAANPKLAPALSEVTQQLSTLPDSSVTMAQALEVQRARFFERYIPKFDFAPVTPAVMGSVVDVWRDRLAIWIDNESPLPPEGSFMAVYDSAGIKADAYVVRVRGRLALSQFTPLGSCLTPEAGDRAVSVPR